MIITSEQVLELAKLKDGDVIVLDEFPDTEITLTTSDIHKFLFKGDNIRFTVDYLIGREFKISPKKPRIGDKKCDGKCFVCPCTFVCNRKVNAVKKTLYEVLNEGMKEIKNPSVILHYKIYDAIKEYLDKEVEE